MKRITSFLAVLCLGALSASAADDVDVLKNPGWNGGELSIPDFLGYDMAPWTKDGTPVLFTACMEMPEDKDKDGNPEYYAKDLIFIPPGATKGKYVILVWERGQKPRQALLVRDGSVTIGKKEPYAQTYFPDQGGDWLRRTTAMTAEYLLRRKMTLITPKDFRAVLSAVPQQTCPAWDVPYPDPTFVIPFYHKHGWDKPIALPSAAR
jgi:hypothetical protein